MNGMSSIVKTIVRFVSAMIMLFGVYLILHGEKLPGGGFGGGVILASSFVLLTLAYGKKLALEKESPATSQFLASIGALIFMGAIFIVWPESARPYVVMVSDLAIGMLVGGALFLAFMVLASYRIKIRGGK